MPQCTCLDWKQWNLPCQHFFAIFQIHSQWNWNRLPQEYLQSPYLTIDSESLSSHFKDEDQSMNTSDDNILADREEMQQDSVICNIPRSKLPKQDSLVLRPQARNAARRRAKAINHKYRALIRRGRVRDDWRHRNRVGQKADALMQTCAIENV